MLIEFWQQGRVNLLRCQGKLGRNAATEFVRLLTGLSSGVKGNLVTSWGGIEELEACAFSAWSELARLFLSSGGEVIMVGLAPEFRARLRNAGLESCFAWRDSEEEGKQLAARLR